MIVILLITTVVAITAATNDEAIASTHINPEYLKPREEYNKPLLYDPNPTYNEIGRYHNNYFGQYAGDYNSHYEYIGQSFTPSVERNSEIENIYANHIPVRRPYFSPLNRYGYIPAKDAYHNVSPYVERRVDNYDYNHVNVQEGQNQRLYDAIHPEY